MHSRFCSLTMTLFSRADIFMSKGSTKNFADHRIDNKFPVILFSKMDANIPKLFWSANKISHEEQVV